MTEPAAADRCCVWSACSRLHAVTRGFGIVAVILIALARSCTGWADSVRSEAIEPATPAHPAFSPARASRASSLPFLMGVNFASGSFGRGENRVYGRDYVYAGRDSIAYFASKGFNLIRLNFRWENLQPELQAPLSADELGRIDAVIAAATQRGFYVAIDPHNYARYRGQPIGDSGVPVAAFADLWSRLGQHYRDHPRIIFDLMNEPHGITGDALVQASQAAITAIRSAGARNTILVEGNRFSGAWHWLDSGSDILASLKDPAGNLIFSPHQYLDDDGSGAHASCVNGRIGRDRLQRVTEWARGAGVRLLLGEFGAATTDACEAAVSDMLDYMHANADVWAGWAWWAGGPWWGSYFSSIEPERGVERPQMNWLSRFLP